jgi:ABC-type sugar transport system ATPase subunit
MSKQFGGVYALKDVDLDIRRGEVHGLVGANGAGKSTLIRCLAGVTTPDHGSVSVDGTEMSGGSTREAEKAGLAFIHQELNLVPHFTAIQNILLGVPKVTRLGIIDWKASSAPARAAADRIGITFSLDARVDGLSVGDRWLVMIAKALVRDAKMIAMDEPTASLSDHESQQLFSVIRDLAAHDVAVLYVSHRLDEVLNLSDRVTVFRDGSVTHRAVRGELDKPGLIRAIVGREVEALPPAEATINRSESPLFEARGVAGGPLVHDVSFRLYRGEVLGFGGLVGAGRTELARLAFGADRLESGSFHLDDAHLRSGSVTVAIANGIGLVPEERRSQGLMLEKSVAYNINVAVTRTLRSISWLPFISAQRSRDRAERLVAQLAIKTSSVNQTVGSLSGGNQQKALIARWLTPSVKVLFLDEPSRGVDIGARQEIHRSIRDLATSGVGTVVISSDNEELVALCDRVIVMCEGRVAGEVSGQELTESRIIELSYNHTETYTENARGDQS